MAENDKTKKVDPGWNDPPTLNYSHVNPPPKSRIGNKRIAFPLYAQSNSSQSSGSSLPKETNTLPTAALPDLCDNKLEAWDSAANLRDVINRIDTLLANKDDQNGSMRKKIDVMKAMWEDNKFSNNVQKAIVNMVKQIVDGNAEKANESHLHFMMENSSLCDSWIIVIRQLIQDINKLS